MRRTRRPGATPVASTAIQIIWAFALLVWIVLFVLWVGLSLSIVL